VTIGPYRMDVELELVELDADNATLRKEPRDLAGENTGATGLLQDSVGCIRNFP